MHRRLIATVLACAAAGCDTNPFSPSDEPRPVIQAYLFAGEPVTDVRVTTSLPLGSTDSVAPPVNDAEVALLKDGRRYALAPTPGDSGYYHYEGADLEVAVGDVFDLQVSALGRTATARTVVPPPPAGMSLSPMELEVDQAFASQSVVVRWANPGAAPFFVTHRPVEDDPEPIFDGTVVIRAGLVVSEPTTADSVVISRFTLRHLGRYQVKLHRVNEEYQGLYIAREQDTRDLAEPPTNIEGGLGIFTAFSSRSDFVTVSR